MKALMTTFAMMCASVPVLAGTPTHAYIIEGSGFFGAPGVDFGRLGLVNLSDPSDVATLSRLADDLRFGGADIRPGTGGLSAFENTTNALRGVDPMNDGNALIDSVGFMDSGVAGMAYSNDGSIVYLTTTVGAFVRILEVNADTAEVMAQHNIITDSVSSLAVVPEGHPTLNPGDLYGLALTGFGSLRLVHIDLGTDSIVSSTSVIGIGFDPQFETGLDFSSDGTLYAIIQGFDEVAPDIFVEISSHLYTINPGNGSANDLGVIQGDGTWDAVTLVIDDGASDVCDPDLNMDGELDFFDISFLLQNSVDFNGDTFFDFFDISAFLQALNAGCP